jgi:hypothetical protein
MRTSAELEACFMKALEKHMGGLEMNDENVRKVRQKRWGKS